MKLCFHGHELTNANTGWTTHASKSGRIVDVKYCKQCRRDATARYAATHKRRSRAKKKNAALVEARKKPVIAQRLACKFKPCRATAETLGGILEHERRIHPGDWSERRLGA